MFGEISPKLINLLVRNNTWKGSNVYQLNNLGLDPTENLKYQNTTLSTGPSNNQVSPAHVLEGQAFTSVPVSLKFRHYLLPNGGTSVADATWKFQSSNPTVSSGAWQDAFEFRTVTATEIPYFRTYGRLEVQLNQSNQDPATSAMFFLTNPSGSYTNQAFKFGSTIKYALTVGNSGTGEFKSAGGSHSFYVGSTITSGGLIAQIYGGGIYNAGGLYNQGRVTAGQANFSPPASLNSFGSTAVRGVFVNAATFNISDTETVVYGDAAGINICQGTPTGCNTYVSQVNCNAHTGVGCSWFTGNPCSNFNGNQSNCDAQSPCAWETLNCSGANNTDQSSCENQDDAFGGNCSWDTGTCPSLTGSGQGACQGQSGCTWNASPCSAFNATSQATCEVNGGCTWTGGDCHAFDNTDISTCETNIGCSWDGTLCNGTYDAGGLCAGEYNVSCTGNLCNGTYATGNCNGSYGAECQGSAACGNLTDDGQVLCEAEVGCNWATGGNYTLPASSLANSGNTSRLYWILNIGASGTINVLPTVGDTLQSAIALTAGQKVAVHNHQINATCSTFLSSGTCTPSGCAWFTASCGDFGADEATCNAQSGNGCSWNAGLSTCEGTYSGSAGSCSGSYVFSKKWYKLVSP